MRFGDFKGHFNLEQHSNLQSPGLRFLAIYKQACAKGFKVFLFEFFERGQRTISQFHFNKTANYKQKECPVHQK